MNSESIRLSGLLVVLSLLPAGEVLALDMDHDRNSNPSAIVIKENDLSEDRVPILLRAAFPGQEVLRDGEKYRVQLAGGAGETVRAGYAKRIELADGGSVEWLQVLMETRWKELADDATAGKFRRPKDTIRLVFACTPKGGKTEFLVRSYGIARGEIGRVEILSLLGDGKLQAVVEHSSAVQPAEDLIEVDSAFTVIALPGGKVLFSSPLTNAKSVEDEDAKEYEFDFSRKPGAKEYEIRRIDPRVGNHEWEVFRYQDGEYRSAGKGVDKPAQQRVQSLSAWATEEGKRLDAELRWPGPERVTETPPEWRCKEPKITPELTKEERLELARLAFPGAEVKEVPLVPMGEIPDFKVLAGKEYAKDIPMAKAMYEVKEEGKEAQSKFLVIDARVDLEGGRQIRVGVLQAKGLDPFSAAVLRGPARKTPLAKPACLVWQLVDGDKVVIGHRKTVGNPSGLTGLSSAAKYERWNLADPTLSFAAAHLPSDEIGFVLQFSGRWPAPDEGLDAHVYESRLQIVNAFDGLVLLNVPVGGDVSFGTKNSASHVSRAVRISKDDLLQITLEGGVGEETYVYAFTRGAYRFEKSYVETPAPPSKEDMAGNSRVDLKLVIVNSQGLPVPKAKIELEVETETINILKMEEDTHEVTVKGVTDKQGRYSWKGKVSKMTIWVNAPGYEEFLVTRLGDEFDSEPIELVLLTPEEANNTEVLIGELKQKSAFRRALAAEKLGRMKTAEAVEPLIAVLKDSVPRVRREAATALGELGDERALEPLKAKLEEKESSVGVFADMAVKKIQAAAARRPARQAP